MVSGRAYGPFIVERELGRGRRCEVYEGRREDSGERIILKLPRSDLADLRPVVRAMRYEVEALESLDHPAIPKVLQADFRAPVPYVALSSGRGLDLDELLAQGSLAGERILAIAASVLEAFRQAHACGVLHLGLEARRLRFGPDGLSILGFGHAAPLDFDAASLRFRAPEQLAGEPGAAAPPADIWSIGVLYHRLLTGRYPVEGDNPTEVAARVMLEGVAPIDRARVPRRLRRLIAPCERALSPRVADRPDIEELAALLDARGRSSVIPWLISAALLVAIVVLGLAGLDALKRAGGPRDIYEEASITAGLPREYLSVWSYQGPADLETASSSLWRLNDGAGMRALPALGGLSGWQRRDRLSALFGGRVEQREGEDTRLILRDLDELRALDPWCLQPLDRFRFRASRSPADLRPQRWSRGERRGWVLDAGWGGAGALELAFGAARWQGPALELVIGELEGGVLDLRIDGAPRLRLDGPRRLMSCGDQIRPWALERVKTLRYQPGRIPALVIDGAAVSGFDKAASEPGSGSVGLAFMEGRCALESIVIEGRPLAVTASALAAVPEQIPAGFGLRIDGALSFEDGGAAFLRLEDEGGLIELRMKRREVSLIRNGSPVFRQALERDLQGFFVLTGGGRWQFDFDGQRSWAVDAGFGGGVMRPSVGGSGARFVRLALSRSLTPIATTPGFPEGARIVARLFDPRDPDGRSWQLDKKRGSAARGALARLDRACSSRVIAVAAHARALSLLAAAHCGQRELYAELMDGRTRLVLGELFPERERSPGALRRSLLAGFGLAEASPQLALAAAELGLALEPEDPAGRALAAALRAELAPPGDPRLPKLQAAADEALAVVDLSASPWLRREGARRLARAGKVDAAAALLGTTAEDWTTRALIFEQAERRVRALDARLSALAARPADRAMRQAAERARGGVSPDAPLAERLAAARLGIALSHALDDELARRRAAASVAALIGEGGEAEATAHAAYVEAINGGVQATLARARRLASNSPLTRLAELRWALRGGEASDELVAAVRRAPSAAALGRLDPVIAAALPP